MMIIELNVLNVKKTEVMKMSHEKCENCMHKLNNYCRAYHYPLEMLNVNMCRRYKVRKSNE
jgi:hypothetical protein